MSQRYFALACQTIVRPITEDVRTRAEGIAIIQDNLDAAGIGFLQIPDRGAIKNDVTRKHSLN